MKRQYFKNLNGIRFILAFAVIIHHIENMANILNINNHFIEYKFLGAIGGVAVSFFFTLSGFLITHILLVEKKSTNSINLKVFYKSRILRIWPLYFIILFTSWFLINYTFLENINNTFYLANIAKIQEPIYLSQKVYFLLSLFFLPQLAEALSLTLQGSLVYASQIWSIGVEELFYLFWPIILLKAVRIKKSILTLIIIYYLLVVLFVIIYKIFGSINIGSISVAKIAKTSIVFLGLTRIPCIMIGAIAAKLHFNNHKSIKLFTNKWLLILAIMLICILLSLGIIIPFIIHEIFCVLFLFIIFNLIKNNKSYFLENKIFNYLGKISYGLYMYHMIAIMIAFYIFQNFHIPYIFIYIISTVLTIFISILSYEFIEKRILLLKIKN